MMKKMFNTLILFLVSAVVLNAGENEDKVKDLADAKNWDEAAKYIPAAIKENWESASFFNLCGDVYFEIAEYQKALEMYERSDKIDSGEEETLYRLGKTYTMLENTEKAMEIISDLANDEPKEPKYKLALANIYIKLDSFKIATLEIKKAIDLDDENAEAFLVNGELYYSRKVYELAKQNFEKALALDKNLLDARIKLATSYFKLAGLEEVGSDLANEYYSKSLKEWNIVTEQAPNNSRAQYNKGKILYFSKNWSVAADALTKYIELKPDGLLGRWYLAQALYEAKKCDEAQEHLDICAENIDTVKVKAKQLSARCYFESKDYPKAKVKFAELKELGQLDNLDLKRYAHTATSTQDTSLAIDLYKQAINNEPEKSCKIMQGIGKLILSKKRYDEAVELFEKHIATKACDDSTLKESYYWIGVCKFTVPREDSLKPMALDSAFTALNQAIMLDSTFINAYVYLADVLAAKDDVNGAIDTFEKAIEIGKADTAKNKSYLNRAYQKACGMLLDKKDFSAIKKVARDWTKTYPKQAFAYLYLAVGHQGSQEIDAAITNFKKVLAIDPKNKIARKSLNQLTQSQTKTK